MGLYLNPGNETFAELVQADIYVDKTGLIAYMNGCIGKAKHLIASSRPRRFGKTLAAQMLTSYLKVAIPVKSLAILKLQKINRLNCISISMM